MHDAHPKPPEALRGASDSPRWCAKCGARGDHHTDRHPISSPAETLRRAATLMREHGARGVAWEPGWDGDYAADKGWLPPAVALPVADWLDGCAWLLENDTETYAWVTTDFAIPVARAYLGEPA